MAIKLLYIAGSTHSGTTLLNRILGAHPRICNAGGLKNLPNAISGLKKCSCGAGSLKQCAFWKAVDETARVDSGKSLPDLDVSSPNMETFSTDNLILTKAIAKLASCDVIVDSSRKFERLEKLLLVPEIEVFPVHLFKLPVAQAASWKKKRKSRRKWVKKYWKDNRSTFRLLENVAHTVWISYESFCATPESECKRILARPGIPYDKRMLNTWGDMDLHILGGNRMARSKKTSIRLDDSWRERLSLTEKCWMHIMCYPLWRSMKAATFNE